MKLETRQAIERRIVKKLVETILAAGHVITICDGEACPVKKSANKSEIIENLFACDEEWIRVWRKDGDGFKHLGTIMLVYGNDGYDVICDYHTALEDLLKPVNEYAEKQERIYA